MSLPLLRYSWWLQKGKNSNYYYPETCFAIYRATLYFCTYIHFCISKTALPTILKFCVMLYSSEMYFQKSCISYNNFFSLLYFKNNKEMFHSFIYLFQFQSFPRRYFENDSHKTTFLDHFLDSSQNIVNIFVPALLLTATMKNNLFNTLFNEGECKTLICSAFKM